MDVLTFCLAAVANLLGSVGGVSLAFYIERQREKCRSVETYREQLYACNQALELVREQCEKTRDRLRPGETPVSSFDAPLLQNLLNSSGIQRHSSYGIIVCVASLAAHLKTIDNEMQHFRSASPTGLWSAAVAYVKSELDITARVTKYVQELLGSELNRLKHREKRTPRDKAMIDGLTKTAGISAGSPV